MKKLISLPQWDTEVNLGACCRCTKQSENAFPVLGMSEALVYEKEAPILKEYFSALEKFALKNGKLSRLERIANKKGQNSALGKLGSHGCNNQSFLILN